MICRISIYKRRLPCALSILSTELAYIDFTLCHVLTDVMSGVQLNKEIQNCNITCNILDRFMIIEIEFRPVHHDKYDFSRKSDDG